MNRVQKYVQKSGLLWALINLVQPSAEGIVHVPSQAESFKTLMYYESEYTRPNFSQPSSRIALVYQTFSSRTIGSQKKFWLSR